MKAKWYEGWFQCALCPREEDTYYEIIFEGKKIRICQNCLKKIKRREHETGKKTERKAV